MDIELFTPAPFSVSREEAGIVLLAIVLSAICVYAPCRWSYRRIQPPGDQDVRRYLPYLYVVFFFTVSAALVKNYLYFRYVLANGYLAFFTDYYRLAATVPLPVRLIAVLDLTGFSRALRNRKRGERNCCGRSPSYISQLRGCIWPRVREEAR